MKRSRSRLTAATILSGLLFALATGPANADTGTVTLGSTAPSTAASAGASISGSAGGSGANPLNTITCTGTIDNPHKSTHVPGTINVEDSIRCTAPVTQLSIQTGEYRNGFLVGSVPTHNNGQSVLAGAYAIPCVSGVYIGAAAMNVIFPPGYFPPFGGFIVESPPIPIKC